MVVCHGRYTELDKIVCHFHVSIPPQSLLEVPKTVRRRSSDVATDKAHIDIDTFNEVSAIWPELSQKMDLNILRFIYG